MVKRRTHFNHRRNDNLFISRKRAAAISVLKWVVGVASFIDTLLSIVEKIAKIK